MKTLITALALASILATAAVAKSEKTRAAIIESHNSVVCSRVVLADPDPAIRVQLLRDCAHYDGAGN